MEWCVGVRQHCHARRQRPMFSTFRCLLETHYLNQKRTTRRTVMLDEMITDVKLNKIQQAQSSNRRLRTKDLDIFTVHCARLRSHPLKYTSHDLTVALVAHFIARQVSLLQSSFQDYPQQIDRQLQIRWPCNNSSRCHQCENDIYIVSGLRHIFSKGRPDILPSIIDIACRRDCHTQIIQRVDIRY